MPGTASPHEPQAPLPLLSGRRTTLFTESKSVVDKLLSLDKLRNLYRKASATESGRGFHQNLLDEVQVTGHMAEADLSRIPATGPVVAVANHPFGMLEGSLLNTVLPKARQDYKIMTNHLLEELPELRSNCIFVDPFDNKDSAARNLKALKAAISWLRAGHMLVIFPAGEVSHWNFRHNEIEDPEWNNTVSRLIRLTKSAAIPLFFKGFNSVPFQVLGMVHPKLRTARLAGELFNKRGRQVEIRVGSVIPFETIQDIPDDTDATRYLRWRTYLLGHRGESPMKLMPKWIKPLRAEQPLAGEMSKEQLLAEIALLPPAQTLEDSREYSVFLANAEQMPNVLREVGRLRELTFRRVGEGTGKSCDLDTFDTYYQHLILWNKLKQEVVGAYRVGNTQQILGRYGVKGLYTSTLFQYDDRFFERIGPSLELGRSFVRPEYQKKYTPLLLLWKGLGRYIARNPETPVLFGAVSISNEYTPLSRQLVAQFLENQRGHGELGKLVKARRPFRHAGKREENEQVMRSFFRDLDSLSAVIADMETDGKGVPILIKQYVKLGGRLLGFNIDPHFSDALDGLVLVDLRETEREILDRYMGKEGATLFLAHAPAREQVRLSA